MPIYIKSIRPNNLSIPTTWKPASIFITRTCAFFSKICTSAWGLHNTILTLFRMGFFGAAHGWGVAKRPPSLKSVTHIIQWWNLAQLYLTQRRSQKYMNHVTHLLSSADISTFSPEISKFCYIKRYRYGLYFDT